MINTKQLLFTLFLSCSAPLWAQDFMPVPKSDYTMMADSLPKVTLQKEVGRLSEDSTYTIEVEYPETEPLTKKEIRQLKKSGATLTEHPEVESYMSIGRKRGYAVVSFTPVILRDGKWQRIVSCKVSVTAHAVQGRKTRAAQNGTTTAERYAAHSVLSSGTWVKIRVKEEGIYELTASKLKDMGFKDISRVKVYGYGGRLLPKNLTATGENALTDDLEEIPLYRKKNSVLFFAEGTIRWTFNATRQRWTHENNHYSAYSYYFVTEGDAPLSMSSYTANAEAAATLTTVTGHALKDDDAYGWYEGGVEMYDSYDFINGSKHTFSLETPGLAADGATSAVEIAFSASNSMSTTTTEVTLGDETLGKISVAKYDENVSARESRNTFTTTALQAKNDFVFSTTEGRNARLNYICVSYPRTLDATATPYAFVPDQGNDVVALSITGATASTEVWQLGYTGVKTQKMTGTLSGSTLSVVVDDPSRRYVIVDTDRDYAAPDVVGTIECQDLHADQGIDMVIIIPESGKLQSEAERLASAHEAEGLRVKVVAADRIYNEFSSGTPDATAYRRYMKMLYDRATTEADMPRYLLLFGDCAWDNRMLSSAWKSYSTRDFLLCYEVSATDRTTNIPIGTLNSYVTDDYFAFLDDGEGENMTGRDKMDIAVGRFPCHDAATAKVLVDKTLDYMQNNTVGAWKNRIVMIADNNWQNENNVHMRSSEVVTEGLRSVTDDLYTIKKIYPDAYTYTTSATGNTFPSVTKMLQEEMKRGALMFNYMGHGSPDQISHCKLLGLDDFALSSVGRHTVWVFASCEVTPYDVQETDIGRVALYNEEGGAVAVMCASRSVYANYNESLNLHFSRNAFTTGSDGRLMALGEALRLAKVSLVNSNSDRTMNKLKYCLLGDPALSLGGPAYSITLDSINDEVLTPTSYIQLKAGQKVYFKGSVKNDSGLTDDAFSGIVTATLFDRLETITCKNNGGTATSAMTYQDRGTALYEGSDSVRNGRFTIVVTVPRDISYSTETGRMDLYAVNTDHTRECHGKDERFHFNGTERTEATDSVGPQIYVWLNAADFPDGGYVQSSALLGATLSDSSGIHSTSGSVGHDIELVLDYDTSSPVTLNDYFTYDFGSSTSGSISYPLQGLTEGRHTLAVRAWDLCDNSSTACLTFFVVENLPDAYDINAVNNPAYTSTNFVTTLEPDESNRVTTEVYDMQGRRIWAKTGNAAGATYHSVVWDLTTQGGNPVDGGIYIYRAIVHSDSGTHETKSKKMIVVRQ